MLLVVGCWCPGIQGSWTRGSRFARLLSCAIIYHRSDFLRTPWHQRPELTLTPSQTRNKINVVLHVCGYPLFLYYYVSLLLLSESCPVTNVVPVSSLSVVQRTRRVHHHHLFCIKPNSFRKRTYFKHCRHTWIELHTYISRLQLPVGPTQNQLLLKPDINDFWTFMRDKTPKLFTDNNVPI